MSDKPQRAVTMTLTIGADRRQDMGDALREIADRIESGDINGPTGASGAPSVGYGYEFKASESPTHEEYHAQLRAYLEKP